jgi:hypothetical protein
VASFHHICLWKLYTIFFPLMRATCPAYLIPAIFDVECRLRRTWFAGSEVAPGCSMWHVCWWPWWEHCSVSSRYLLCLVSARLKRRQLSNKDLDVIRDNTPSLKQGSSQMFRSLRDKGKGHWALALLLLLLLLLALSRYSISICYRLSVLHSRSKYKELRKHFFDVT